MTSERIALLVPTRGRRERIETLALSATQTADEPERLELVIYIDDDDDSYENMSLPIHSFTKIYGPRLHDGQVNLSVKWNQCWEEAMRSGSEIFMHCGDDIVFRTKGWDTAVRQALNSFPGKIGFVWCNDQDTVSDRSDFGTHGFVHKNWTDVIGRFVPPYFVSDYNDTWFNDVAESIGVRKYLHGHLTEHMHFIFNKATKDQNTLERLARHEKERPDVLYHSAEMVAERQAEAQMLRAFIEVSA